MECGHPKIPFLTVVDNCFSCPATSTIFRWFKFTLKPPIVVAIANL